MDTSAPKFKGVPGLTKWAETQNLKTAAHAFAVGGSVPELQAKMDALKKEMEKQMTVMKQYMEKQGIQTRETAKSEQKRGGQER